MFRRFLNLFRPNRLETDIREELEFHRAPNQWDIREYQPHPGSEPGRKHVWLETLVQDLRYALR
jgi:hypothetical protein